MVDISVNNLTKFFVIGENLLEGLSFDVQEGECVAILGRNGCGKTTLFKILTGEMDYDDGEVYVNPNKRLGLISQIPRFPAGFTVEDVLRSAYAEITRIRGKMEALEAAMAEGATQEQLREYDKIEREAHNIANMRGWILPELNPGIRTMSEMMSRMKLMGSRKDSKIAGMMIQGNTRGVITNLKNLHQYSNRDSRIEELSNKLLEKENDNIRQMEPFL